MSTTSVERNSKRRRREAKPAVPVTLLSGFLGSGKSTLLHHILRNKQDLKCAVVVNDMAEINVDSALLRGASLVRAEEKLIEFQNGCICCTLREDLLVEVSKLVESGSFDAIVIESTGISEPMQVAETFSFEDEDGVALQTKARLDTCVTVVDAAHMTEYLASIVTLSKAFAGKERVPDEDDRNVSDLLLDQLEFADVVLLNKVDLVPPPEVGRLLAALKSINPGAKVIPTSHCKVPLEEVLRTGRFDMERASNAPGWLRAMKEGTALVPETEEYGISSFVYRARRPFHPGRLGEVMEKYFSVNELAVEVAGGEGEGGEGGAAEEGHDEEEAEEGDGEEAEGGEEVEEDEVEGKAEENDGSEEDGEDTASAERRARESAERAGRRTADWGTVLRSKGFLWLGSSDKHDIMGSWSHAGNLLTFGPYGPWFCNIPPSEWPDSKDTIERDFVDDPFIADRRQEIVFIGQQLRPAVIKEVLDGALLTDGELAQYKEAAALWDPATGAGDAEPAGAGDEGATRSSLPWDDPFEDWPPVKYFIEMATAEEEEEEEEGEGETDEE